MSKPTLVLKNQFGEQSNAFIVGGSSRVFCDFIVDSTNGNGLGIRSLKGYGVENVYMHTSATPAAGSPNPEAGYIIVQLAKGYNGYERGAFGFVTPVSGTPINITSGVTKGLAYVITSVGTTTQAQWQAIGLAPGIVPAVGVSFFASVTGNGVGTGVVEVPATAGSGITGIEVIGDPNLSSLPTDGSGSWFALQCMASGALTAPAAGTVISLSFQMYNPVGEVI